MPSWEIPPARHSKDIVNRIQQLLPEKDQNIPQQHVVSKVVLKGFASRSRQGQLELTPFDLTNGRQLKPQSPTRCGRVPNFLKFASRSAEQIWGEVENRLPAAILAAQSGRAKENDTAALSDCVALHVVRSIRYLKIHMQAAQQTLAEIPRQIVQTRRTELEREFLRRHGVHAAGPEALLSIAEDPIRRWRDHEEQGVIARQSMEEMYERVRVSLRKLAIQVYHVPIGQELLISDCPAFVARYRTDGTLEPNVAIGDSNVVGMPIAINCVITLGPDRADGDLTASQVEQLNRLQIEMADRFVYYRPSSKLRPFVEAASLLRNDPW